jgi:hypothetical protein
MTRLPGDGRRAFTLVLVLALVAAGCSRKPKPSAEVPPPPPAETATRTAGRNANGTGGTAPTTPKRPAPAPAPAPPPAKPTAPDVGDVQAGSSTSQPAVVPQLSAAEQERLERETKAAVEQAQREIGAVDSTKLDVERNRKYLIAKDFLAQAVSARGRKEYERAQQLAVKAKLLAEEIAPH